MTTSRGTNRSVTGAFARLSAAPARTALGESSARRCDPLRGRGQGRRGRPSQGRSPGGGGAPAGRAQEDRRGPRAEMARHAACQAGLRAIVGDRLEYSGVVGTPGFKAATIERDDNRGFSTALFDVSMSGAPFLLVPQLLPISATAFKCVMVSRSRPMRLCAILSAYCGDPKGEAISIRWFEFCVKHFSRSVLGGARHTGSLHLRWPAGGGRRKPTCRNSNFTQRPSGARRSKLGMARRF